MKGGFPLTVVQRAPWVRWRQVGERLYLYDDRARNVHVINNVGASIWKALEHPIEPGTVAASVAPGESDEVLEFIQELVKLGCVISY